MKDTNNPVEKRIICFFVGHSEETHLDLIYGSLPREHKTCKRCHKTLYFEKCSDERADELNLVDCF